MTGYVAFVIAANFLVRLVYPVGTEWLNLQLGYFPAYIGLYMAGIAAYRGNWLQRLDERSVRKWRWPVLLMILMLPAGMALGGALKGGKQAASDHGQFQSLYRTKLIIAKKTPGKMPGVFLFEP